MTGPTIAELAVLRARKGAVLLGAVRRYSRAARGAGDPRATARARAPLDHLIGLAAYEARCSLERAGVLEASVEDG
jgi:hypothetical protein